MQKASEYWPIFWMGPALTFLKNFQPMKKEKLNCSQPHEGNEAQLADNGWTLKYQIFKSVVRPKEKGSI